MRQHLALKIGACLLLASSLSSCVSYDSGASDDDIASNNNVVTDNSINTNGADIDNLATPCEAYIWKPASESDGNLALIFSTEFPVPFSSVEVFPVVPAGEPEVVELCIYSSTDENGRQVWRCAQPGAQYTGDFFIEYGTKSCMGAVEEPGERTEEGNSTPAGVVG